MPSQTNPRVLPYAAPVPDGRWARLKTTMRKLGPAGIMGIFAACMPAIGLTVMCVLLQKLADWLRGHGGVGITVYIVYFWVFGGLALLPTYAQSILGGYTYHFRIGLTLAVCSILGALLVSYTVARITAGNGAMDLINQNSKWKAVHTALMGRGFWRTFSIVMLLRLSASPFAMTNVIMGSVRAPFIPFACADTLGMIPRTALIVYTASRMERLSFSEPSQLWSLALSVGAMALAVIVIAWMARRAMDRVTG